MGKENSNSKEKTDTKLKMELPFGLQMKDIGKLLDNADPNLLGGLSEIPAKIAFFEKCFDALYKRTSAVETRMANIQTTRLSILTSLKLLADENDKMIILQELIIKRLDELEAV